MKILYDHQIYSSQNHGGISRYFYELVSRIKKTSNNALVEGTFSNNIYLLKLKKNVIKILPHFNFPYKSTLLYCLNFYFGEKLVIKEDYDLLHPTYYHPYFLKKLKGKPYVITVYDMIHEMFSQDYKDLKNQTSDHKRKTILNANKIIAISENTKKDLVKIYKIPKERVDVVYLGNPLEGVVPSKVEGLPKKYLLFVGNRIGYKNFNLFAKAVVPLLNENKRLSLVCSGGGKFNKSERKLLSELGIFDRVKQVGFKSDNELAYIYKNAFVYVLPSLYEGFGMTALEAFSMGCPVVASNTSSIPEVCGKAVVYINPKNTVSIRNGIKKVMDSKKIREDLITLGFAQVKKFTWDKTVKKTIKVYEKATNK
jgi:glycosyltransferase involved in cell wall biosynthesis